MKTDVDVMDKNMRNYVSTSNRKYRLIVERALSQRSGNQDLQSR